MALENSIMLVLNCDGVPLIEKICGEEKSI